MDRVIIGSPYSGDTIRNIAYAWECLRHSLDLGEAPVACHLLYPHVLDDTVPRERERGIQAGFEWITAADKVAFYIDYGWSPGMILELKVARTLRCKVDVRRLYVRTELPKEPIEVHNLLRSI